MASDWRNVLVLGLPSSHICPRSVAEAQRVPGVEGVVLAIKDFSAVLGTLFDLTCYRPLEDDKSVIYKCGKGEQDVVPSEICEKPGDTCRGQGETW
jgi:hypothetical protein